MAATLSEMAYDEPKESLRELLLNLQLGDASVRRWKQSISEGRSRDAGSTTDTFRDWRVDQEGLLRYRGSAYVPNDPAVRQEIMKMNHDDPYGGHFGVARTTELIRRKYYWPSVGRDIKKYVSTCDVCQRTKAPRHKPYGELQLLPIPTRLWMSMSMDMIVRLPPSADGDSKAYDAILVTIDRFNKMAKYFPIRETINAHELVDLFHRQIVCSFGTPSSIISDHGRIFTSQFWSSLCFYMKARRKLSMAFHPQTDGQTERQNQTLEQYLRCYINYRQDDWVDWLPQAEFTYNNTVHSSTRVSPFFALYGYNPDFTWDVEDAIPEGEAPVAHERTAAIKAEGEQLAERLREASEYQAKYYNQRHAPQRYRVGDEVLLSLKNIRLSRPSKKLDNRFLGPFRIIEAIGKQAYRLDLPKAYSRIHPVFHVSLLEPYRRRPGEEPSSPPAPELLPDGEEYEVEDILDVRQYRGKTQYLVKWLGYPHWEKPWENESNLSNARELLEAFKARHRPAVDPTAPPMAKKRWQRR